MRRRIVSANMAESITHISYEFLASEIFSDLWVCVFSRQGFVGMDKAIENKLWFCELQYVHPQSPSVL